MAVGGGVGEPQRQCESRLGAPAAGRWAAPASGMGGGAVSSCGPKGLGVARTDPADEEDGEQQLGAAQEAADAPTSRNDACEERVEDADRASPAAETTEEAGGSGAERLDPPSADATHGGDDVRDRQPTVEAESDRPTDGGCSTGVSAAASGATDASARCARKKRRRAPASSLTLRAIDERLGALIARSDEKRAYFEQQEAAYTRGRERLAQLEREFKELTAAEESLVARKRELRRVERLMRGPRRERRPGNPDSASESSNDSSSCSSSDSDSSSSSSSRGERQTLRQAHGRRLDQEENDRKENDGAADDDESVANASSSYARDADADCEDEQQTPKQERERTKKRRRRRRRKDVAERERKRLRRFRDGLALRFQLLRSECRCSELQTDKLLADLRREYMDSYLFAGGEFQ